MKESMNGNGGVRMAKFAGNQEQIQTEAGPMGSAMPPSQDIIHIFNLTPRPPVSQRY